MTIYTPFGHSDWREIVARIKAFGSEGKRTAVISTINGDANTHFYRELDGPTGERQHPSRDGALGRRTRIARSVGASGLAGQLAAWNYFQSVKSPENDAFVKMWADFNEQRDKTTNDPMEATFIGFRMWAQAVTQAGTTDVNAVRQAMYGQRVKAPSGFEVVMNTNHHLSKPAMIGKLNPAGTFDVVWRSINPIKASVWSRYHSRERKTYRRLDLPLGLRRMRRADIQGMVIEDPHTNGNKVGGPLHSRPGRAAAASPAMSGILPPRNRSETRWLRPSPLVARPPPSPSLDRDPERPRRQARMDDIRAARGPPVRGAAWRAWRRAVRLPVARPDGSRSPAGAACRAPLAGCRLWQAGRHPRSRWCAIYMVK